MNPSFPQFILPRYLEIQFSVPLTLTVSICPFTDSVLGGGLLQAETLTVEREMWISSASLSQFADGAVPSFPASCFSSFFPLAPLLILVPGSFLAAVFLGLGSGFGGTGFADNLADRLVGSCLVSLGPSLPSVFSGDFLFGIMTTLVQQKVKQRAGPPGTPLDVA